MCSLRPPGPHAVLEVKVKCAVQCELNKDVCGIQPGASIEVRMTGKSTRANSRLSADNGTRGAPGGGAGRTRSGVRTLSEGHGSSPSPTSTTRERATGGPGAQRAEQAKGVKSSPGESESIIAQVVAALTRSDVIEELSRTLVPIILASLQESNKRYLEEFRADICAEQAARTKMEADFAVQTEVMNKKIRSLEDSVAAMEGMLAEKNDEHEQSQKRNSLRFFGVWESEKEVTKDAVVKTAALMGVTLSHADIEDCRRVGMKQDGARPKPRPIVCRFSSYAAKTEVYRSKKNLGKKKISVREDLTYQRVVLVRHAVEKFGTKNVWTSDGAVLVAHGGKIHRVTMMKHINSILP